MLELVDAVARVARVRVAVDQAGHGDHARRVDDDRAVVEVELLAHLVAVAHGHDLAGVGGDPHVAVVNLDLPEIGASQRLARLAARCRELGEAADDQVGGDAFGGAHWARSIGADGCPSRRSRPHARRAARSHRGLQAVSARDAAADPVGTRGTACAHRGPGARRHGAGAQAAVRGSRGTQAGDLAGAARHHRPREHARALRVRGGGQVLSRTCARRARRPRARSRRARATACPGRTRSCACATRRSSSRWGGSRSTTGSAGRHSPRWWDGASRARAA